MQRAEDDWGIIESIRIVRFSLSQSWDKNIENKNFVVDIKPKYCYTIQARMSGDVSTLYHEEIVLLQMCILPKDLLRTNVPHNAMLKSGIDDLIAALL